MTLAETAKLLALIAVVDNRRVTTATVTAWHSLLEDVPYQHAVEAMKRHRREEPGVYLEPGHIYKRAQQVAYDQRTWLVRGKHLGVLPRDFNGYIDKSTFDLIEAARVRAFPSEMIDGPRAGMPRELTQGDDVIDAEVED